MPSAVPGRLAVALQGFRTGGSFPALCRESAWGLLEAHEGWLCHLPALSHNLGAPRKGSPTVNLRSTTTCATWAEVVPRESRPQATEDLKRLETSRLPVTRDQHRELGPETPEHGDKAAARVTVQRGGNFATPPGLAPRGMCPPQPPHVHHWSGFPLLSLWRPFSGALRWGLI